MTLATLIGLIIGYEYGKLAIRDLKTILLSVIGAGIGSVILQWILSFIFGIITPFFGITFTAYTLPTDLVAGILTEIFEAITGAVAGYFAYWLFVKVRTSAPLPTGGF